MGELYNATTVANDSKSKTNNIVSGVRPARRLVVVATRIRSAPAFKARWEILRNPTPGT